MCISLIIKILSSYLNCFHYVSVQNYNVVNYDEKVVDGFYDVYGVTSDSLAQGKMPLLVDLQAISVLDNIDYEVLLVNRMVDPELQRLEKRAYAISKESHVSRHGLVLSGLIQNIANIVVDRMGGPVGDANEMLRRWVVRRYELRSSMNTIILPLGCLDVGLSRHRALLFKVVTFFNLLPKMTFGQYACTSLSQSLSNGEKCSHCSE